jgi:pimeloyl-ACP methyl ester carboxylesterase
MSFCEPRNGVVEVNGTVFFVERRGQGVPLLLVHGAGQDAGMLAGQARALATAGFQVLVYDRRGTGHSGRDGWPGSGAEQHADDAAALIRLFSFAPAVVVGLGSGGIIAVALAELHPDCVAHAVAWEPPAAGVLPRGREAMLPMLSPVAAHLAERPHDYIGAQAILLSALTRRAVTVDDPDFARERVNAEAMVRDEPAITLTTFGDPLPGKVTLAQGEAPSELVRDAAAELGRRTGRSVRQVTGRRTHGIIDPAALVCLVLGVLRDQMPADDGSSGETTHVRRAVIGAVDASAAR